MPKKTKTKIESYTVEIVEAVYCDNCNIELNRKTAEFGGHHSLYERRELLEENGELHPCKFPTTPFSEVWSEEAFWEIRLCDKCFNHLKDLFPCFERHEWNRKK